MFTFIMPVYISRDNKEYFEYFKKTIASVLSQTDNDWSVVIIDDCSNNDLLDNYVQYIIQSTPNRIIYHHNELKLGAGLSRNVGVKLAASMGTEVIMFLDADDIADTRRVEVTKEIFKRNIYVDLVYSSFIPIDQNDEVIGNSELSKSIMDILDATGNNPPIGYNVWKKISAETGYVNLTSSTSVKINIALETNFPDRKASEDAYAWMLYSAKGAYFYFTPEIPSKYRIPRKSNGSSSRSYVGRENFYMELSKTNEEAFWQSIKFAIQSNNINENEIFELKNKFYMRLCKTLVDEGMNEIADEYYEKISSKSYLEFISNQELAQRK